MAKTSELMGRHSVRPKLTRRRAVTLAGMGAVLCASVALDRMATRLFADEAAYQEGVEFSGEGYWVAIEARVDGLGLGRLQRLEYTVEALREGVAVKDCTVQLRLVDADGYFLAEVDLPLDFSEAPLVHAERRDGSSYVNVDERTASVQFLGVSANTVDAVWVNDGVEVYVLDEVPQSNSHTLDLLVCGEGGASLEDAPELEFLRLHALVSDDGGQSIGAPVIEALPDAGTVVALEPSIVVRAELPWRDNAVSWSVESVDVAFAHTGETEPARGRHLPADDLFEIVEFGSYPTASDGAPAPIEWYVLEDYESFQLLFARAVLDCVPYNDALVDVSWPSSSLREWLNGEFFETAFNEDERAKIAVTTVHPDDNPDNDVEEYPATDDRVFCLGVSEAMSIFHVGMTWWQLDRDYGDVIRFDEGGVDVSATYELVPGFLNLLPETTDYAVSRGALVIGPAVGGDGVTWDGYGSYWLRTMGLSAQNATGVGGYGWLYTGGWQVDNSEVGVRPALWKVK